MVLHEVLQDLGLGGELVGAGIDLLDLGKDHIDDVVLLEGLVVELLVVLLRGGVAEGGIEDLLLDLRVDLELLLDALEQGLPPARGLAGSFLELAEELPNLLVILLEQGDRVFLRRPPGAPSCAVACRLLGPHRVLLARDM